jgi:glycerol-3-phosphate dehydrogenase (NAD(P)+)
MLVTVLGAGYMGSAMAQVAAMRGHDVRLWGTWLDDDLIAEVEGKRPHSRLKMALHERITPFRHAKLAEALAGAELVVHGVSSEGAVPVMTKAAAHVPDVPIVSVTKGFLEGKDGKMHRIDEIALETVGRRIRFVHAAGPAKAIEIARSVLTWMFFAAADIADAKAATNALGGDHLRITASDDIAGAEICSAMKNAYATGLGIWDGLVGPDCHNARAACFQQAVFEMATLVKAGGGKIETAYAAPGVGDLHVTAAAGRNRAFGEGVGKGKPAKQVASEMAAINQLTEGYPAIKSAWRWAQEHGLSAKELPLLQALHAVVWEDVPVAEAMANLQLST